MKKKIIWTVIAVLIIIVALIGILYYTTDLFKSPEQLFYKHFADSSNLLGKANYEDLIAEVKEQSEASVEVAGEITAKVTSDDEDTQEIATVLEKGKITYNIKTVGSEQKMQNDVTLNYNGKDIITLNILRNKDQYGLKIEEAYDKYVSVENNNLKALFQKIGMDTTNIPDRIEMVDYYDLLNIDKDTLNHIEKTYSDIIKQNIPEESYSVEKDVTVKIDGADVKTNAYKLTLTEEQLKNVLVKVLETLKEDDTTLDLIVSKVNQIMEPYETMGVSMQSEKITKETLIEGIEDVLNELNQTSVTTDKALEVVVYATKDGKTKFEIIAEESSSEAIKMEIDMLKLDNDKKMVIACSYEDSIINMEMLYNDTKAEVTTKIESDGTTVQVSAKQDVKATENVTVEDFTNDNSVKLNDMTEAELENLVQTIYTNVIKALPEKMQLLGITETAQLQPAI